MFFPDLGRPLEHLACYWGRLLSVFDSPSGTEAGFCFFGPFYRITGDEVLRGVNKQTKERETHPLSSLSSFTFDPIR